MMQWFRIASLSLAVAAIGFLPLAAQPDRRGSSDRGDKFEKLEDELAQLRRQLRSLERKLEFAKWRDKGSKDGFGKSRAGKGKSDETSSRGFGPMGGRFGPGGFGPMSGRPGFGPMGGGSGRMQGRGDDQSQKGEKGQEGNARSQSGPKGGGASGTSSSSLERKLDQIQRDLEEIRREMRRR